MPTKKATGVRRDRLTAERRIKLLLLKCNPVAEGYRFVKRKGGRLGLSRWHQKKCPLKRKR